MCTERDGEKSDYLFKTYLRTEQRKSKADDEIELKDTLLWSVMNIYIISRSFLLEV